MLLYHNELVDLCTFNILKSVMGIILFDACIIHHWPLGASSYWLYTPFNMTIEVSDSILDFWHEMSQVHFVHSYRKPGIRSLVFFHGIWHLEHWGLVDDLLIVSLSLPWPAQGTGRNQSSLHLLQLIIKTAMFKTLTSPTPYIIFLVVRSS